MKKSKTMKKVLSLFLVMVMVLSMMPTMAFATEAVVDDYTIVENTEGETQSSDDDVSAVVDDADETVVAQIGDDTYATLAEAVANAEPGDTVVLMADVDKLPIIDKAITIDGDGYSVAKSAGENQFGTINGTVTLKDLVFTDGDEAIRTDYLSADYSDLTLVIDGCTFNELTTYAIMGGKSDPENHVLGELVVRDCSFNAAKDVNSTNYMVYAQCVSELTVEDCEFDGGSTTKGAIHTGDSTEYATVATIEDNLIEGVARGVQIGNRVEGSSVDVSGNTFTDVTTAADDKSGAVYIHGNADENVAVSVTDNEATGTANVLYNDGNNITEIVTSYEGNIKDGEEIYIDSEGKDTPTAPDSETPTNGVVVNGTTYTNFDEAITAANGMTGDVTVEIYDKVTLNTSLSGNYESIKFVGKETDAEIYLDVQGYITAPGKKVDFENLTLSKSAGGFITNAGFMNVAFGVYNVAEVNYTNCTFTNGAYASSGKVTFTSCTFYRSHDKYGLWAYGDVDVTVNGCNFADYRGIKMYAEGAAKTTALTVENTDFSAVNDKPAIVLTYGESVTLENNKYSSTGVFELDLDGAPNGTTVTSDVAPTCKNDNGACGVLVDGKIYTTVAQAADVATSGSTVTLLHDSAETVELAEGVTLNKNGYEAANVTVVGGSGEGSETQPTGTLSSSQIDMSDPKETFLAAEITGLKATKSVLIKLYSGDEQIATTTLLKPEYYVRDTLGAKIIITGESSSWKTEWAEGMPRADKIPTEMVLVVDGKEMNTANVPMIKVNGEASVNWADVPGVEPAPVEPAGNDLVGYTNETSIWGETWGNAKESFVVKVLDANGEVMGTTSLNNIDGIIDGDVAVTWNLKLDAESNTDDYWDMEWITAPSLDNMPAKVELWVDGVQVSDGEVRLNGPDDLYPVFAAKTDDEGKILSYISRAHNADASAALTNAINSGDNVAILAAGTYKVPTGKDLTITGAVDGVVFACGGANITLNASVVFNNVTFNWDAAGWPYHGLAHCGGMVYNDCIINGTVWLYGTSEHFKNCTFNVTGDTYNVWTYGAKEVKFEKCTFNSAGKSVLIYSEDANLFNDVTVTDCDFIASAPVEGKAAIEMDSSLIAGINLTIDSETTATGFGTGNISGNNLWNNKKGSEGANNDITVTVAGEVVLKPTVEPQGDITTGYVTANYNNTGESGIFGQADEVVGTESFVVKLYSGETLVGTAKLVDTDKVLLNGESRSITWHILTDEDDDSWWDTDWVTALNVNAIPNKVELWVDGVLVDTGVVELNNTDLSAPICAAVTNPDGSIKSFVAGTGYLNGTGANVPVYDEALQAALNAGGNIVMLRDVTLTEPLPVPAATTVALDLNGKTVKLPQLKIFSGATVEVKNGTLVGTSADNDTIRSEGGNLTLTDVNVSGLRHTVRIISGTATINGGTYTYGGNTTVYKTLHVINVGDDENPTTNIATVTIKDGTFIAGKPYTYDGGCAVKVQKGSTVTIEGGNFSNGVQNTLHADAGATLTVTGGTYDQDPTAYVAEGYAALPDLYGNYVVGEKPTATVNNLGAMTVPGGDYICYPSGGNATDMPLNFVMQFVADQDAEDMQTSPFADWYADFVITFEGIEDGSFNPEGCYLAGFYGETDRWEGLWVKIPVGGLLNSIDEGTRYPVMMGVGMPQTYDYICSGVQAFSCAMYIPEEILEANPDLKVNLELNVVDSSDDDLALKALQTGKNIYNASETSYTAEDFVPKNYVAQIGETKYETLAEALEAAQNDDTVELIWTEGDAPIPMNGSVFGKTVTITGTATVDWSKGNLFVGRGGEGNGTVIFDNANLTSASNSSSYGIHVSGREKDTTDKYDGTLEIEDSAIELDYLINKGTMTLNNSTLTVKNGFSIGGRPASETESGEDATATISLTNGSKVIVNNHNGMGLGYEAIGVMNIDATSAFETTQSFLVTAKGTMNLAGTAKIAGTLTNDGTITLTDVNATLTTATKGLTIASGVDGYVAEYADGKYSLVADVVVSSGKLNTGVVHNRGDVGVEDGSYIYFDITELNASNSIEIKVYSDATLLSTTKLNETGIAKGYLNLTELSANVEITKNSSSWDTTWVISPVADIVPNKAVLYVDGKEMNAAGINMYNTDRPEDAREWKDIEGVEAAVEKFVIDGANMTLGSNLAINFYIKPSDLVEGESYYAVITKEYADGRADVVKTIMQEDWSYHTGYKQYYVTFDGVAAKEMTDKLTVVVYNSKNEAVSEEWVDSVRDYTMRVLLKEEAKATPDTEKLTLYVDMLNYGAAAQVYFENYHSDDLANSQLTDAQKGYATASVELEDKRVKGEGYSASSLTLESEIVMNFFFLSTHVPVEHNDYYAVATFTDHYGKEKEIRIEGEEFKQLKNDTDWYVSVTGMAVADCEQMVTVNVYNGDGGNVATGIDSVESYVARNIDKGAIYEAIMKFATSAYASFH